MILLDPDNDNKSFTHKKNFTTRITTFQIIKFKRPWYLSSSGFSLEDLIAHVVMEVKGDEL
jgi:hypothetical protein